MPLARTRRSSRSEIARRAALPKGRCLAYGLQTKYIVRRLAIFLLLLQTYAVTSAATKQEIMFSRYLKYNFCMQTALGQHWWETQKVAQGMNKWGISESTETAIKVAAETVQIADARCRKANDLLDEPRPFVQQPKRP